MDGIPEAVRYNHRLKEVVEPVILMVVREAPKMVEQGEVVVDWVGLEVDRHTFHWIVRSCKGHWRQEHHSNPDRHPHQASLMVRWELDC